jgi:periplasmic protein TonB
LTGLLTLIAAFAQTSSAPPTPAGVPAVRARAKANLASLIREGDYPSKAMRKGEQGAVAFTLEVAANGRVTACRVTSASRSASLDEATCRIMTKRARFTPARDAQGNPVSDIVDSGLVWRFW